MADKKTQFKLWHLIFFGLIILMFVALKLFDIFYWPKADVKIGDKTIKVLVADTPSHRYKGWSGASDMGRVQGMWFKFDGRSYQTVVMRDMEFPLDIVWIDGNKVVDIAPDLAPEKGRVESQLTLYRPRLPATAVLELPRGFVAASGLKIGDEVDILND